MSTRTTGKRTLEERVRNRRLGVWPFHNIVRAELDRLARQVRKLKYKTAAGWRSGVLSIIEEAKQ